MAEHAFSGEGPGDVARLLARDEAAWRELHDREFASLYRFARGMGADPDLAEDCASESFSRLLHRLGSLRFDSPDAVRRWLLVVCRNYLRDQLRKRRGGSAGLDQLETLAPEADSLMRVALARALASLPDTQREVLVMRFTLGMTTQQVAGATGRGVKAIESLQHRALEALRKSKLIPRDE